MIFGSKCSTKRPMDGRAGKADWAVLKKSILKCHGCSPISSQKRMILQQDRMKLVFVGDGALRNDHFYEQGKKHRSGFTTRAT